MAQNQVELCGVMLDMPHAEHKQLRYAQVEPFKPAALSGPLLSQRLNHSTAFSPAMLQISLKFRF